MSLIPLYSFVRVPLVAALAVLVSGSSPPPPEQNCTGKASDVKLFITVENVKSARGLVAATLYPDDSKRFLKNRGSLYMGRVPARAPVTTLCIHVPTTGVYALAVYHDADSNKSITRNAIGLPAEGFGFTNNPSTLIGPPSFKSVRIAVPRSGTRTRVKLRYL